MSGLNNPFNVPQITVGYQKPSGTSGGQASTNAWTKYGLNTVLQDDIGIGSVSNNQFNLPAGTYLIHSSFFFTKNTQHTAFRLQNTSDAVTTAFSISTYSAAEASSGVYFPPQEFTINTSKTFEIDYYASASVNSDDLGAGFSSYGFANTYGFISFIKKA